MRCLRRFLILAALIAINAQSAAAFQVEQSWSDLFNGENNGTIEDDYARAITLDSNGNAYVSGFSFQQVQSNLYSPRFVTIKYLPDGTQEWVRFHRQGNSDTAAYLNAVDSNDNVIVSGAFSLGDDWLTIKYDAEGNQIWSSIYQANSTFVSHPEFITMDAEDNIYISGDVGSSINPDFGAVVKIDPQGNQLWVAEYYGEQFNGGSANATAVDAVGNVYLAGTAVVNGRSGEAALVKFNSNGIQQWHRTDGSRFSSAFDNFVNVEIDLDGNIIVAGTFGYNTAAGPDVAISKYDPLGNLIWSREYDSGSGDDTGSRMVLDSQNNIIVIGQTEITSDNYDTLLLKYDTNGNLVWSVAQGGDGTGSDYPTELVIGADENIYFVGVEQPFLGINYFVTASYDGDGNFRWKELYGGPTQGGSRANAIVVDPFDASVYVAGETIVPNNDFDIATLKYSQPMGSIPADLMDVQVVTGVALDGGLPELVASDDTFLRTRSGFGATFVDLHHMEMHVRAVTAVPSPTLIDLSIESRIDEPAGGTMQIRLRNWNTGQWVSVGNATINDVDSMATVNDVDAMDYISATGEIEVSLKQIVFKPFLAYTFESSIDQVQISIR